MTRTRDGLSDFAFDALRSSERRYRRLFESAQDGILLLNAETAQIEDINPCLIQMLGFSREEFVGKKLGEMGAFGDVSQAKDIFAELQTKGYARRENFALRTKAGPKIEVEFVSNAYDCEGIELIQCNIRDMTGRRQAETRRARLEAEVSESRKMEAIGTLALGIARELNNAVTTIMGNVELARQDVSANPLALKSLNQILAGGERARALVQQLLFFSPHQPTVRKLTALAPIVEESIYLLRTTLPERVALEVSYDVDVPPVLADVTQIDQVVIVLVTNAMQAMQGGRGRIDVRLESILLDEKLATAHPALREMYTKHPGRTVRLVVSDDRPDRDVAALRRGFEPFLAVEEAAKGAGLGLPVVGGILQRHEGAIVVDSLPGNGVAFAVYLPAEREVGFGAREAEARGRAATATPDLYRGQHILYLDDDASLVFVVERLLERRGYRVSGYVDQLEALDALRADPAGFDLVVADYNMPDMSGLEVARHVHAIRANLPVIVTSGYIDEDLRAQADSAGLRGLILKASAVENFCEAIAQLASATGTGEAPKPP
jgi:PAS domain S-box-containing protein